MKHTFVIAVLSVMMLNIGAATAQAQITRPIRFIVPYVPGGGTDTLSRLRGPFKDFAAYASLVRDPDSAVVEQYRV